MSACFPVFYILSVGPAAMVVLKFDLHGRPVGDAIMAFYSPLGFYAQKHRDNFEVKLLEKYVTLWAGI